MKILLIPYNGGKVLGELKSDDLFYFYDHRAIAENDFIAFVQNGNANIVKNRLGEQALVSIDGLLAVIRKSILPA